MPGNARLFQESITHELDVIKNRVRNLIGSAHWGEEGRFKEVVLKNILRKFLPNNLSVGSGFILKAGGYSDDNSQLSAQLDIIIYDNTMPVLFSEGDFIITTAQNVRGIVEVKSKLRHTSLSEAISQLEDSILPFLNDFSNYRRKIIFVGIFAFEFEGDIDSQRIDNALTQSREVVNHISLGTNYFIRYWKQEERRRLAVPVNCPHNFYNVYHLSDLSFSYFISNLIHITSGPKALADRYWFSFPIQGTKEINRMRTICLDQHQTSEQKRMPNGQSARSRGKGSVR